MKLFNMPRRQGCAIAGPDNMAEETKLVGMGLRVDVSPVQTAFYILLVMLGILGNATVVVVIGKSVIMDHGGGHNSDIIITNMALSNLMVSVMRNTLLIISDMGIQVCCLHSLQRASEFPFSYFDVNQSLDFLT